MYKQALAIRPVPTAGLRCRFFELTLKNLLFFYRSQGRHEDAAGLLRQYEEYYSSFDSKCS